MMERQNEAKYVWIGCFYSIIFAVSSLPVRFCSLPPLVIGFYRVFIAVLVLTPFYWRSLRQIQRRDLGLLALSGLFYGLGVITWNYCLGYTTMANANLFSTMTVFAVAPLTFLIYKERISKVFLVGALIAIAGVVLLLSAKTEFTLRNLHGDLLAFCSALTYAGFLLSVYRVRDRVSHMPVIYVSSLASMPLLLALVLLTDGFMLPQSAGDWGAVLWLGVITQSAGMGLVSLCAGKLTVSLTALVSLLQPVFAAVIAWLVLDERLQGIEMLGIAVIIVGIYVAQLKPQKKLPVQNMSN